MAEGTFVTLVEFDINGSSSWSGAQADVAGFARKAVQGVCRPGSGGASLAGIVEIGAVDCGVLRNVSAGAENRKFCARRAECAVGALNGECGERRAVRSSRAVDGSGRVERTVGTSGAVEGEGSTIGAEGTFGAAQVHGGGGRAEASGGAADAGARVSGNTVTEWLIRTAGARVGFSLTQVGVVTGSCWVNVSRSHSLFGAVVAVGAG